ncbi:hypothetical protein AMAG_02235 [Allomyces macrogynus ATCC 38327]|uniref:Uncharacterized protein n=1 Tax=Allomyces macrogynus (strain ATCC 38327) TaxID=578462 RepID=A0A0L0S200_ALLM3|nr:hypothetical protein AMAG_02235 [Allomyces macrogynus ATCC 38327]|eukprot:KNE56426.1 hypothetical protein AMAG_02235 [Allomyces macrogynus ATCC 38327]
MSDQQQQPETRNLSDLSPDELGLDDTNRARVAELEEQERRERMQHPGKYRAHAHEEARAVRQGEGIPAHRKKDDVSLSAAVEHTQAGLKVGDKQLRHPAAGADVASPWAEAGEESRIQGRE